MRRACIVDIVRTPFAKGRAGGALSAVHPVDLLARTLKGLVARTGIDPGAVDDVIAGCVIQVGEQAANIGRQAWLAAGFPETVPAVTIDRKCGSAPQAMDFAAQGVMAGAYDLAVACGVETMSRVPMRSNRLGKDNLGPMLRRRYADGLVHQGISAELIAARWRSRARNSTPTHCARIGARRRPRTGASSRATSCPSTAQQRTRASAATPRPKNSPRWSRRSWTTRRLRVSPRSAGW